MEVSRILAEIDSQIEKLQQARALLSGTGAEPARRRGRPPGSKNAAPVQKSATGRRLTPEGRKRIADAMKRRWAEQRKSTKAGKAS